MEFTLENLIGAVRFTLNSPRAAARAVIGLGLSASTGWTALMLTAVVSTLLFSISLMLFPVAMPPSVAGLYSVPLQVFVVQAVVMTLGVALVYGVGKRFGGTGDLAGSLAVMAWLEMIMIVLQGVQLLAMAVMPVLADAIGLVGAVLSTWLLCQFVAELHGFGSAWKVLGGVFATLFALAFALSVLLLFLGVAVHV